MAAAIGRQAKCEVCGTLVGVAQAYGLDRELRWWVEIPPEDDVMVFEEHTPERCRKALTLRCGS